MNTATERKRKLLRRLDGSTVWYNEEWDVVFSWRGSYTVNVYAPDGSKVDTFAVGDFETGETTRSNVEAGIRGWIEYMEEEV